MSSNFTIAPDDETVIDFGKYQGMTLRQVSQTEKPYIVNKWIKDNLPETHPLAIAINRRKKRQALHRILRHNSTVVPSVEQRSLFEIIWRGLGFLLAYLFALIFRWEKPRYEDHFPPPARRFSVRDTIHYIPHLVEVFNYTVPKLNRPPDIDPSLYGCFVESLVKYSLGFSDWSDAETIIAQYFKTSTADGSSFWWDEKSNNIRVDTPRMNFIRASFNKPDSQKTILDICNLSLASTINIPGCYFNEKNATKLYLHVRDAIGTYQTFSQQLRANYPELTVRSSEQKTTTVSVGAICGQIDAICGRAIVEIKAKSSDDLNQYRRQVFGYACLHRLNYGNRIDEAYVMNFLTGKVFYMSLRNLTSEIAAAHVRTLGRLVCPEHDLLFNSVTCAVENEISFPRVNLNDNPPVLIRQHHRATRSATRSVSVVDEAAGLVGQPPPTQTAGMVRTVLNVIFYFCCVFLILVFFTVMAEVLKEFLRKIVGAGVVIFLLWVLLKKNGRRRRGH